MKPAVTNKVLKAPLDWHEVEQGEWLKQQLNLAIEPLLAKLFGYYAIVLGPLADGLDLSAAPVRRCLTLHQWDDADLIADISQLPLQESAVDACILPFCLDYVADPHQLLREAHRVVIPEGYLLVAGFNPISLLMLGKLLPRLRGRAPWNSHAFSCYRVRDWLQLLGCDIVHEQHLAWSSFMGSQQHSVLGQAWGEKYCPWLGSAYLLLARKREVPLTPVRPVWQKMRLKPMAGLSGATGCHLPKSH